MGVTIPEGVSTSSNETTFVVGIPAESFRSRTFTNKKSTFLVVEGWENLEGQLVGLGDMNRWQFASVECSALRAPLGPASSSPIPSLQHVGGSSMKSKVVAIALGGVGSGVVVTILFGLVWMFVKRYVRSRKGTIEDTFVIVTDRGHGIAVDEKPFSEQEEEVVGFDARDLGRPQRGIGGKGRGNSRKYWSLKDSVTAEVEEEDADHIDSNNDHSRNALLNVKGDDEGL